MENVRRKNRRQKEREYERKRKREERGNEGSGERLARALVVLRDRQRIRDSKR